MSFYFNYVMNMGFPNSRSWKLVYWQPVGGAVSKRNVSTQHQHQATDVGHSLIKSTCPSYQQSYTLLVNRS